MLEGTSSLQSSTAIRDKVVSILQLSDGFTDVEEKNVEGRKLCIDIDHLSKSFGEKNLFQQLSLNIPFGKKVLLTGASGSGKSTLFGLLSGEDTEFSVRMECLLSHRMIVYQSFIKSLIFLTVV